MSDNPWQQLAAGRVLVIMDAAHSVERRLLERWLDAEATGAGFGGAVIAVTTAIASKPENPDATPLLPYVDDPDDTLLLPVRVVWRHSLDSKAPRPRLRDLLLGNPRRPGSRRARQLLARDATNACCIAAEPATLGELRARLCASGAAGPHMPEMLAEFIVTQAGLALDIAERRLAGGRYKVPRRVAHHLMGRPDFQRALRQLSLELGRPQQALRVQAAAIMRELVARPQPFWLDVQARVNHLVMSLGYEPEVVIDREGLERVRQLTREYPSILLWTHKTHVDGFAVNSMLFDNDFPAPHILGGVNMAFAGLGFLARRAGAIFIRRSFQDDLVYKTVLRHYIGYLMEKRFPLTWAFEGTRSRVGKLMPPRYGLLKYVLEAAHATGARRLHIIPVAINYDLIGDVADYAVEQAGASKKPESLRWFLSYLRGLRQPMGQIYFDFGEPVVLEDIPPAEDSLTLHKLAFRVGVEANRVTPITLPSLLCMVLLGAAPRALTAAELWGEVSRLTAWARARRVRLSAQLDHGEQAALDALVAKMVANGVVTRYDDGPERVYAIEPGKHGVAGYYRNTIIHFFVIKALVELSLMRMAFRQLVGAGAFWSEAERLRDFFKFEFFYAPREQFRDEVRHELSRCAGDWPEMLEREGGAASLLVTLGPLVAHATMLTFIEAYRLVADVIARLDGGESLGERECVQQALAYGRQAYLQRRISSEASIGKLLFANGYKLMENLGLVGAGGEDVARRRLQLAQEFRTLQRRVERIRAQALP